MPDDNNETTIRAMTALYRAAVIEVMLTRYRWTAAAAERLAGEVVETVAGRGREGGAAPATAPATAPTSHGREAPVNGPPRPFAT
jgi:hypothetical protein